MASTEEQTTILKFTTIKQMKTTFISFQKLRLTAALTIGLCLGHSVWSAPLIQSIEVSPNPLITGQNFIIAVTASPDVTQAMATVDFRPGKSLSLEIPLTQQGLIWTGTGLVPDDLKRPDKSKGKVKVQVFDTRHRDAEVVHVDVVAPTISAVFAGGILSVSGDNEDNVLTVSRDAAGTILVNDGTVPVTGDIPTVANTTLIRILGLKGNDTLLVDDSNGPMPPANLLGGEGDDTLTGSANADELDGGPGNDILLGRDGNDHLFGGPGNDTLTGGRGVDEHFGGEGDDQIIWNPGDGNDLVEGENGEDTLLFIGANIAETVDVSANAQRLRFTRNIGNITMDCDGIERVIFQALGGADMVTVNDLTGTQVAHVIVDLFNNEVGDGQADTVVVNGTSTNDLILIESSTNGTSVIGLTTAVTVKGAEAGIDNLIVDAAGGDDAVDASAVEAGTIALTLKGGAGVDLLIGSQGNDVLFGGPGNDSLFGGPGNDTFPWNPGDGSDLVEGESGQDTLLFNGANIAEEVTISSNGPRLRFIRNIATITMDCGDIETVQFNALGGADIITVNDLSGTGVTQVNLDLASPPTSGLGDNQPDTVVVNGTAGDDFAIITGTLAGVSVAGLSATVSIVGSEPALDRLILQMLAGEDAVNATGLLAGLIAFIADGGLGNDILVGSPGVDMLLGGEGDDVLIGGAGLDVLDGGPGNNVIIQD